jgi:hypothetical protein
MKKLIVCLLLSLSIKTFAQTQPKPLKPDSPATRSKVKTTDFFKENTAHEISAQLELGTQGIGADLRYGILSHLSGRLGVGVIPLNVNNVFTFSGYDSKNNLSAKFTNIHLLADYSISNTFRIVGGAAYFLKADGNVTASPTDSYQYGDIVLSGSDVGKLNFDVSWKGIAPYLGIGLFKSFPEKTFNVNLDLGTYYLPKPTATITGTKLLSDNSSQDGQFNENMKGYRWLPVLQVNFSFRIK